MPNFLRRTWYKYSKLGKRRKKLQKWRRPTGRDNKLREKRKNRGPVVSIGYRQKKQNRGLLGEKFPLRITSPGQLEKIPKDKIVFLGKVGKKRKIEIAEKADKIGVKIYNLNPKTYLKKIKKKNETK